MLTEEAILILILIFDFFLISSAVLRQKIKFGIPIRETLLMLWQEGIVDGLKELPGNAKKIIGVIWGCVKENRGAIWEFIKGIPSGIVGFFHSAPEPVKHTFTDELYCALQAIASNYTYKYLVPVIRFFYIPIPSYIWVSLYYNKGTITDDVIAEIVWAMTGAFQSYMDAYCLNFQFQAFPYVKRNRIVVRLYYCESEAEYPAYQSKCDEIMQARSTTRPINEADTYDRDF